jgi:CO/xanthine dehydrogenase Mo-binding subunit
VDLFQMKNTLDQAYDLPAFHFDLHLCRTNRPPHTAVRGPGEIQATMMAEHIMEHVAARLGMDPAHVRERNFLSAAGEQTIVNHLGFMIRFRI